MPEQQKSGKLSGRRIKNAETIDTPAFPVGVLFFSS